jgi:hypothetical protein
MGSLAAAAFMIHDGNVPGGNIFIVEAAPILGGSLSIPSHTRPGISMRFSLQDRRELPKLSQTSKESLGATQPRGAPRSGRGAVRATEHCVAGSSRAQRDRPGDPPQTQEPSTPIPFCASSSEAQRINDCLSLGFFETPFWHMWSTTFAFQPWQDTAVHDGDVVFPQNGSMTDSSSLGSMTGDRSFPFPTGSKNLAFVSQFVEIHDDVVFTVEYSIRAAQMAVHQLLGIDQKVPAVTPHAQSHHAQFQGVQMSAISRKDIVKLLSAGGIAAVAAYALREYAPWVDYDAKADLPRIALQRYPVQHSRMQGIIRYATLAANGHNAQAWKFALLSNGVEIHPDYSRRLSAVDPADRELWISLGCALENLLIASRAMGYAPAVTYPDALDSIQINLTADSPHGSPLFEAIPFRQNTRTEYDSKPIAGSHLDQLRKLPLEPGIDLHTKVDRAGLAILSDFVHEATISQYADKPFLNELIHWLRFNKKEALASSDGLYSLCTGNPAVPRWLGQMFVNGAKPQDMADADVKKLHSSAGAFLITSASAGKADWVRTGQVYQRLALMMTSLNIKSAFLNQPLEVESVRSKLRTSLGLGSASPQLLVRFGYASAMPRSLRRPVEQVLIPS